MPKTACGYVAINQSTLYCFGGFTGSESTNAFHLYDVQEGTSYTIYIIDYSNLCLYMYLECVSLLSYRLCIHTLLAL